MTCCNQLFTVPLELGMQDATATLEKIFWAKSKTCILKNIRSLAAMTLYK